MRHRSKLYFKWGVILVTLSALSYGIHFFLFRDAHHLSIFLLGDLSFVFLEVFLVSLIIHRMIEAEDAQHRLEKLYMVIGAFYSEVGYYLLRLCIENDPNVDKIRDGLIFETSICSSALREKFSQLSVFKPKLKIDDLNLHDLRRFLMDSKDLQLRLVENPVIFEHEHFSDLLRSVLHLTEELMARDDLRDVPIKDLEHIRTDLERAYGFLVREWFCYVLHLQEEYPYLFSFVVRTNPFKENPSAVVTENG